MKTYFSVLAATALSAAGCVTPIGTATLHMSPNRPLNDTSVLAPDLPSRHYRKLIVVAPPAEAKGGEHDLELLVREALEFAKKKEVPPPPPDRPAPAAAAADVERGLLRAGVALISSDVAGRAAATDKEASRSERLLALGKATGADAILEVVNLEWEPEARGRWFTYDPGRADFSEVDEQAYDVQTRRWRWSFTGPELHFSALLVDAQNGSVEAEFHIACNGLWNLAAPFSTELVVFRSGLEHGSSANYGLGAALKTSRETCLTRVAETIAGALGHP